MNQLGIFGTSGFAGELADIAWSLGLEPVFVARDAAAMSTLDGDAERMLESEVGRHAGMRYAIGVGDNGARRAIASRFGGQVQFANLIHPTASFGRGQRERVEARRGVVVAAGARLMHRIEVGDFSVVSLNVTVGHDCVIEDFVLVAPGANISGNVHLGTGCWIGSGAAINQGTMGDRLRIGARTTVGSGAVVLRHCAADAVYAGIPAKRIK